MPVTETIVAIATPTGRGGIGIVRVSGPEVKAIATSVLQQIPEPRQALYGAFFDADGQVIDQGIALYFAAPNSFTGEEVLELQAHGGPVVLDWILSAVLATGKARLAKPGEFSEQAFLNDKLDLAQAEAIADLINASSEQAARSALGSMQGKFSQRVHQVLEKLVYVRMYVEAAMDFPEEEIDFLADKTIKDNLQQLQQSIADLLHDAQQGSIMQQGITLAIVGKPNAGKSSLLNALAGKESAIVTDIAGTTRDVLREDILIEGVPLHIVDTAGLREAQDQVEQEGIKRARQVMQQADRILLVVDVAQQQQLAEIQKEVLQDIPEGIPITTIMNKCDVHGITPAEQDNEQGTVITLSAKQQTGIEILRAHLLRAVGKDQTGETPFMARRRHVDALQRAQHHVNVGVDQLATHQAGELLAEDLRLAQQALGEITGKFSSDDLLGEIFSSFCIGK